MATQTYPLLIVVDDSGTITTGATVTIASVTDKAGTAIASPGATLNVAGANVSVDYDVAAKGEAWITLAISKTGQTFTGLNASPRYFIQDGAIVELGYRTRQVLALILAAQAGQLAGAGTGTITVKNPDGSATRIVATTDSQGNRSALTLTPPA